MQEALPAAVAAPQKLIAGLRLPAPSLPTLGCGCASDRQLAGWLTGCELEPRRPDDQQRLAGMLFTLMDEIARWQAPAARRLAMLELLRRHALACVDAMAFERAALAKSQTDELRRAVSAAARVLQVCGRAFAGVAAQFARGGGVSLLAREKCARSLQRAVDARRRVVGLAALFGMATPAGTWRDMQSLVQLARCWKLADRRVRDHLHPRGRDSVARAYLQASLFASADPAQLDAAGQRRLWELAGDWCRAAAIVDRDGDHSHALLASSALDQSPIPASRLGNCRVDPRHFSAPQGWKVRLDGVLALLDRQLRRRRDPLLERARQIWTAPRGRGGRRLPVQRDCDIAFGLSAVCHHLGRAPATPENPFDRPPAGGQRLCLAVDSVDFRSGETVDEYEVVIPATSAPAGGECYPVARANVLNGSGRGAGLSLPLSARERLRVGGLVGLRLRRGWRVAVIRWRYTLPDHCRAGVEILEGDVVTVGVQRHSAAGHLSAPISALLLKGAEGESLLLPVPLFQCFDTIELLLETDSGPVTLQRQTLATGSFARFEFV